jgi:hypothetical protein
MEISGQLHATTALPAGKERSTHSRLSRKVGHQLPSHAAPHPRRTETSTALLRKPKHLQTLTVAVMTAPDQMLSFSDNAQACLSVYLYILIYILMSLIFLFILVGRDSAVGIGSRYGLDGPGIESRWGRYFLHPSRPGTERHHNMKKDRSYCAERHHNMKKDRSYCAKRQIII